jgi:chorismate dehydratase
LAQKIRVGAVSYLNTKPLIYGFEQGRMKNEVELLIDYPSNIASMLLHDEIDIGLVPIAILPELKEHHVISDYCIGCNGEVATVCLFSDVPLQEIETVLLDYQSRTSVELLKILLKEHWNISPGLVKGEENFENEISGNVAGLIIGDRAFTQRLKNKYVYDLGAAWKEMTGLPFVFAAWISNKKLPAEFIANFNAANEAGLKDIEEVIKQNQLAVFDLKKYYSDFIQFRLNADMHTAVRQFLSKLNRHVETVP